MQPVQERYALPNRLFVVLREIANRDFVSPGHESIIDLECLFGRIYEPCCVANKRPQHRRFPRPVSAGEGNLFAAADAGSKVADNLQVAVALREILDFKRMTS